MSSLIVPVVKVENLRGHPNAEKLDICNVLGWQMCVQKGQQIEGQKLVYFPADTVIPTEWAEKWNVTKYLKDGNRVSKVQLRGEPSFGLAVPLPEGQDWEVGTNVADYFNATKYEPPLRPNCGEMEVEHPLFEKFTDIENMRNFPDIFVDGEEVIATEKLHGTSCKVAIIEGVEMAGSKEMRRKRPSDENIRANIYWCPFANPCVCKLLQDLTEKHNAKQVILYGEVFGGSIQNLDYGVKAGKDFGFRAFGLRINGRFLDVDEFLTTCAFYKVDTVPFVYRGPFSLAKMKEISEGKTLMGADHIKEGVVTVPVKERRDPRLGRVILKYVGDPYLFSKNSDYKDV